MSAAEADKADKTDKTEKGNGGRRTVLLVVAVLVVIGVVVGLRLAGPQLTQYVAQFTQWVEGLGYWAPVAFIVGYAVFTVGLIPGSILTMAGGALFGLLYGTIFVTIGAVIGATCSFLISRYIARGKFEKSIEGNKKFAAIDKAIAEQGGKIVLLLRLSPAFPFTYLNYALGLTKVPVAQYVMASVGMIPGTFLWVYYGKAIGDVASIAAGSGPEKGAEQWIFYSVGLLATLLVTTYVTKIARRALAEATDDE